MKSVEHVGDGYSQAQSFLHVPPLFPQRFGVDDAIFQVSPAQHLSKTGACPWRLDHFGYELYAIFRQLHQSPDAVTFQYSSGYLHFQWKIVNFPLATSFVRSLILL